MAAIKLLPQLGADRSRVETVSPEGARKRLAPAQGNGGARPHTRCEYLKGDIVTKLYLDCDIKLGKEEPTPYQQQCKDIVIKMRIDEILAKLRKLDPNAACRVATRHGRLPDGTYKLSYRPYFTGIRIVYHHIPLLLRALGEDKHKDDPWDMGVYKEAEQLLAAVNGAKGRIDRHDKSPSAKMDWRVLRPAGTAEEDVLDYVAQVTDEDWPLLDKETLRAFAAAADGMSEPGSSGTGVGGAGDSSELHDPWVCKALTEQVQNDPGLARLFFGANSSKKLEFRRVTYDPERECTEMYIHKRCGAKCLVEDRVHASNNGAIKLDHGRQRVLYHCFDPKCSKKDDPKCSKKDLDITRYVAGDLAALVGRVLQHSPPPSASAANLAPAAARGPPARAEQPSPVAFALLLQQRWPEAFGELEPERFAFSGADEDRILFEWQGRTGYIAHNTSVVDADGAFLGMLVPDHVVLGPFVSIHKDIPMDIDRCLYNQVDVSRSVLASTGACAAAGKFELTMYDGADQGCRAVVVRVGGRDRDIVITDPRRIRKLKDMVQRDSGHHVEKQLGYRMDQMRMQINIINQGGSVVIGGAGPPHACAAAAAAARHAGPAGADDDRLIDPELVVDVALRNHADLFDRLVYVQDLSVKLRPENLYFCNPATNLWELPGVLYMEQRVLAVLRSDPDLTARQVAAISRVRGRADILYCIASKRLVPNFHDRLNSNPDLFPCKNGVFDMRTRTFRPIEQHDYVKTTTDWDYCPDAAARHRADVEDFLAKVFPVPEERAAVLVYVASMLSGRRDIKRFLVLTDRRDGNNGKSSFAQLLVKFFSHFTLQNGAKLVSKASLDADRNSHDGGLEVLRGMRLVIGDELDKDQKFDASFLKKLTSAADTRIEGRACGSREHFSFLLQAGLILIFNQGQCPRFHADDEAFNARMLVAPMRARFVNDGDDEGDQEPHTYKKVLGLKDRFRDWLPALADILLEWYSPDGSRLVVPPSMTQWQDDLAASENSLQGFFERLVEVTGCKRDHVSCAQLKALYHPGAGRGAAAPVRGRQFDMLFRSYFSRVGGGAWYVDKTDLPDQKNARHVVRGARLRPAFAGDAGFPEV
jgi:D5 N terminal like